MFYDPRGQVIKTENPDGSEQRVVYGVPNSLTTPQSYAPTAWETYTYDANDLTPTSADYGTPKSAEVDALGRTIKTLDRLESSNSITNNVRMQYSYDVRGNLLEVTDAYERTVFTHVYDLRPPAKEGEGIPPLKTVHINKGTSTVVFDCTGKPVETRDAKGALTLHTYDVLQRPTSVWCRDIDTEDVTLRNYVEYGTDNSNNNKGKNTYNYNESGLVITVEYDFKGNLLTKFQQTIANEKIQHVIDESESSGWTDIKCYRVDWTDLPGDLLGSTEYRTDMTYDALNRLMQLTYPEDANAHRKVLVPTYNKAGALQQVDVDDIPYVTQIGYNAKGQRLIIAYGNGLMTRYTYNEQTFRLTRMRTEGYTASQSGNQYTYAYNSGTCKQDMAYTYDKVGNILSITNAAPQSGEGGSDTLEREFDYDALYRLLSASGRENQPTGLYWDDSYRSDDVNSTTAYTQNYDYDLMGNLNELQHTGDSNFTRTYNHSDNLLESFEVGSNTYYYQYDVCGNQIQENEERHMQWDYADRLRLYYNQTSSGSEPSVYTHYLYDTGGNRVKKYTRTAGGNWETITYIDGIIEYREDQDGNLQSINHVMDDTKRIATIREGNDFGDTTPAIKYNLDDHLGSSNILVDENGTLVNQEEYYPFGETSFGSYAKKRYRFCGKEKDEESGMYYYGARYYSPWLCRFISVDPLAADYPYLMPYNYAGNKPITHKDIDGMQSTGDQPVKKGDTFIGDNGKTYTASFDEVVITGTKPLSNEALGSDNYNLYVKPIQDKIATRNLKGSGTSNLKTFSVLLYKSSVPDNSTTIDKLTEIQKQGIFESNSNATVAILLYEFATGTSPAKPREFNEDHAITQSLKNAASTKEMIETFYKGYVTGEYIEGKEEYLKYSSSPDQIPILESIDKHVGQLLEDDIVAFSRGGLEYYVTLKDGMLNVRIRDFYSLGSYLRSGNNNIKGTPFSNTAQTFSFSIKFDTKQIANDIKLKQDAQLYRSLIGIRRF
jgi:RHS repeat-associated protein